jgi:hypothetical protein
LRSNPSQGKGRGGAVTNTGGKEQCRHQSGPDLGMRIETDTRERERRAFI